MNLLCTFTKEIPKIIFYVLLCFFCLGIFYIAGWRWGDDYEYLSTVVQGQIKLPPVYPEMGRFYPLGHIEYNLFLPFGDRPSIYFFWLVIKFCLFFFVFSKLFDELRYFYNLKCNNHLRYLILLIPFLSSNLVEIYSTIIYPEATLLITLLSFLYFYFVAMRTNHSKFYLLASLFAIISIYLKEPVFLIILSFAIITLCSRNFRKTTKQKLFLFGLIFNSLLFIGLYWYFIVPKVSNYYYSGRALHDDWQQQLYLIVKKNLFIIVTIIFAALILFLKSGHLRFIIIFYFLGIIYICSFLYLRLPNLHLLMPALIFIGLSLGISCMLSINMKGKNELYLRTMVVLTFFTVLAFGINNNFNAFYERIAALRYTREIQSFYKQIALSGFTPIYVEGYSASDSFINIIEDWRYNVASEFYANANQQNFKISLMEYGNDYHFDRSNMLIFGSYNPREFEHKYKVKLKYITTMNRLRYFVIKSTRPFKA